MVRAGKVLRVTLQSLAATWGGLAQAFSHSQYATTELAPNHNGTFFGYYDKTPFSLDDRFVLGMNRRSPDGSGVTVGYFDLQDGNRFHAFGETTTWSWQLGARLQWVPGRENDTVCYNRLVDGDFGSVVQNVYTGRIEAEYPVWATVKNRAYLPRRLAVVFERQ